MLHEILEAVAAPVAVVGGGANGAFVLEAVNQPMADQLGRAPAGLVGQSPEAVLPGELVGLLHDLAAGRAGGEVDLAPCPGRPLQRAVVRRLPGDGERFLVTFQPRPAGDLGAMALDILDRQSEMISRWMPDGTIAYCNQAFAALCGLSPAELIGRSLFELTPPEEMAQILHNVRRLSARCPTAAYDHHIPAPDGTERWQAWIDRAILGEAGQVEAYLSVGRDITARKAAERRLVESERRLKLALEAGRQGVWEMDLGAGCITVDATFEELLGFPAGSYTLDLERSYAAYHPDDRERVRAALAPLLRGEADDFRVEARRAAGDGGWRWVLNFGRIAERDEAGQPLRVVGTTIDISQRREAEEHLRDSEQRLRLALEAGNLGVWESDLATDRVRFDPICLTRLGWAAEPCELGLAEVIALIHPRDRARVRSAYAQCRRGERAQARLEYRVRRRDGAHAWIEEHAMAVDRGDDGRPRRLVGVSADITPRKAAEMQLAHLALHDPLTGLPNRRALAEALDRAMASAQRSGQPLAILALDLDGFKQVNDRHGHPAGDGALVEVAARLRRMVRRADLVARVGGDEFAVIAGELKGPTPVVRLARRIQAALAAPIPLAEGGVRIGVSIGVAFFPGDGATPEQLLRRADAALYGAKRDRVGWRFSAEVTEPVGPG